MQANTLESAVDLTKKFTSKPSNEELLKLYSLYKQATEGDNKEERPGGFDFVAAAKYNSWLVSIDWKIKRRCLFRIRGIGQ
jgi:diazepam-binding inhibitor (GABA receptor modulator, acyl-CoA-binding protein)